MSMLDELGMLLRMRVLQLLALVCLLVALAALSLDAKTSVMDPDIWWHARVGDWIVQHHAVPHTGLFSRTAAEKPWVAYSWGAEVLQSRAYDWFGLIGFAAYGILLTVAVAWTVFWMAHRLSGRFWVAWLLCAIGGLAFLFSLMPRPVFYSMMLCMVALTLILEGQRSGRVKSLLWLPVIFVVWANIHIQFVYGLFVVGVFVVVNSFQQLAKKRGGMPEWLVPSNLKWQPLLAVLAACVAACCIGPYNYHLFEVVLKYSQSRVAYEFIQELQPLSFKYFPDYILVMLMAVGFFTLGHQKKIDTFRLTLLSAASLSCFRTTRDAWFAGVCAVAFIADATRKKDGPASKLKPLHLVATWVATAAMLALLATNMGFTTRELDRTISSNYPVDAVNYLRRNPAPGPLYNTLDWGGFLIWYMPDYPVAIDGRNDLYGDEMDTVTFKSVAGDYSEDKYLSEAGIVLLPKDIPLARLIETDSRFRKLYEDGLAVVFVRN
jgi:hypothetical protein